MCICVFVYVINLARQSSSYYSNLIHLNADCYFFCFFYSFFILILFFASTHYFPPSHCFFSSSPFLFWIACTSRAFWMWMALDWLTTSPHNFPYLRRSSFRRFGVSAHIHIYIIVYMFVCVHSVRVVWPMNECCECVGTLKFAINYAY